MIIRKYQSDLVPCTALCHFYLVQAWHLATQKINNFNNLKNAVVLAVIKLIFPHLGIKITNYLMILKLTGWANYVLHQWPETMGHPGTRWYGTRSLHWLSPHLTKCFNDYFFQINHAIMILTYNGVICFQN